MGLIGRWMINVVALFVTTRLVGGVAADSTGALLVAAAFLGIVNAIIRPLLLLLTLPFTIATLGLSVLLVNGLMFLLVARCVSGFEVVDSRSAVVGALVFSIASAVVNWIVRD